MKLFINRVWSHYQAIKIMIYGMRVGDANLSVSKTNYTLSFCVKNERKSVFMYEKRTNVNSLKITLIDTWEWELFYFSAQKINKK
jgi:hypothetical protein